MGASVANRGDIWVKSVVESSFFLMACLFSFGADASQQYAQKYVCVACHHVNQKMLGPSWASIREKYKDGNVMAEQLATSIRTGSSGKWGAVSMPPQGNVPEADARVLAAWILKK
jgi:cytochrome c